MHEKLTSSRGGAAFDADISQVPKYLYKYVPWNDGARAILRDGTMKFTSPNDFNDPFDCRPQLDGITPDNIYASQSKMLKQIAHLKGHSGSKGISYRRRFAHTLAQNIENGSLTHELLSRWGVVSLTKNPVNILMWSHYADNHNGVVIEFHIPTPSNLPESRLLQWTADNLWGYPVQYHQDRPTFHFGKEPDESYAHKMLYAKSELWKYEEEYRVAENYRGPGIYTYSRDEILSSVICGMKMEAPARAEVENLIFNIQHELVHDVAVYQAEEVAGKYAVSVPNHPRANAP